MSGKNKCKILKEIRQQIADANDIPYVTTECRYQGNCQGTCPKCEAELVYLEKELQKRKNMGKAIVVAGLAAATLGGVIAGREMISEKIEAMFETYQLQGAVGPIVEYETTEQP